MKNLKKAVTAVATIAAITTSMMAIPVSASQQTPEWNTNGGRDEREGGTYVVAPVIEVELPGSLEFGLNPLKLEASEDPAVSNKAQIVSGTYVVTNYSNVPVEVTASTKVTAGADVEMLGATFVAADWDATNKQLNPKTGKKAVLLVQMYPSKIENDGSMTVGTVTAGRTAKDIPGDILTTADPATTPCFVLDSFDEDNAKASMAGFKFDGALDPNAAYTETDIKVSTVFTMNTVTEDYKNNNTGTNANYEAYKTNGNNTPTVIPTIKKKK